MHAALLDKSYLQLSVVGIKTPQTPIFPRMYDVNRDDFLKNLRLEKKYKPDSNYLPMRTLTSKSQPKETFIFDILDGSRHVMVMGQAGSGKSSSLRYFAQQVALKTIPAHADIELVIYLEFKHFVTGNNVHLKELLLGDDVCPELSNIEQDDLYQWAIENKEKVLIVCDGYDQISDPLLRKETRNPGYKKIADETIFIKSILNKKLFGNSRIVTSSREYAVAYLPTDCLPDKFIMLAGFKNEDVDKLVVEC